MDFILKLNEELSSLPFEERRDIIADYEEHFRVGEQAGKSEAQIAAELGEPSEIAGGYLAEAGRGGAKETDFGREPFAETDNAVKGDKTPVGDGSRFSSGERPGAVATAAGAFAALIYVPVMFVLYFVLFALFVAAWVAGAAMTGGGFWAVISSFAVFGTAGLKIGSALLGLALTMGGVIVLIAMSRESVKLLRNGLRRLKRLSRRLFGAGRG